MRPRFQKCAIASLAVLACIVQSESASAQLATVTVTCTLSGGGTNARVVVTGRRQSGFTGVITTTGKISVPRTANPQFNFNANCPLANPPVQANCNPVNQAGLAHVQGYLASAKLLRNGSEIGSGEALCR